MSGSERDFPASLAKPALRALHAGCGRVAVGCDGHLRQRAVRAPHAQPLGLQGAQRVAARHHADRVARLRQGHAQPTSDGACAVNTNFHGGRAFVFR